MPLFTIINKETNETKDMMCSYVSLQEHLKENPQWQQQIGAPALVTHTGNVINKTSGDWKNHLERMKKHSGNGSTIKT